MINNSMNTLIPKSKHAIIRISKLILNTDESITEEHVSKVRQIILNHMDNGMSPTDIKKMYSIEYTDFGMFIKKCLGLKILSTKDAVNNYFRKIGRSLTDAKKIYQKDCSFKFDPYSLPDIPGYNLLLELGIYHPINNPNGVCRDHMLSVEYGWRNNIAPEIISSPHNCQFITNLENITKNSKSALTIDELEYRIANNVLTPITKRKLSNGYDKTLSRYHKQKISETNKKYMNITNGDINMRILKTSPIPDGFRRGMKKRPYYSKK